MSSERSEIDLNELNAFVSNFFQKRKPMKQQKLTCTVLMFLSKLDTEDERVENKSNDNCHHDLLEK